MNYFIDWREHEGSQAEKFYKTTLWQGQHAMVGVNYLEPNQTQKIHADDGADKFYFVLAGRGRFSVAGETRDAEVGALIVAPAGVAHGVTNTGSERLSLLVAMAPGVK